MKSKVEFIAPAQKGEYEYIGFDLEANAGRFIFPCRYLTEREDVADAAEAAQEKEQKEEAKKKIKIEQKLEEDHRQFGK